MVLSNEGDEELRKKFEELCADLNMDRNAFTQAWENYFRIGQNYTLEGEGLHWLACALYVACRSSTVPTVGRSGAVIQGNCVSLTRLLRSCKLSLLQFFTKMKKWSDMASLPSEFINKVFRLERNFAVSTVIFKKYQLIFLAVFKDPSVDPPRVRSKKAKRQPCSAFELFSFCWTLFVQVRGHYPAISDDLVNSFHLLLCCVDFIFNNVLMANRRDLLNSMFQGLPENFSSPDYKTPSEPTCVMELLCKTQDGVVIDAIGIKEHWWKPYVKKLFDKRTLKGKVDHLTGLLDQVHFEANNKAINSAYETYVLNVGDFDERIFLGESANEEIGAQARLHLISPGNFPEHLIVNQSLQRHMESTNVLAMRTPLTGRRYLADKEIGNVTPVSTATQSVSKLQAMLSGHKTTHSDALGEIFKECSTDPTDFIVKLVDEMGKTFCTSYAMPSEDHRGSHIDFAKKRLQLGESLFYKTLEGIMVEDKKRKPASFDFSAILMQEMCQRSLFACCLEIVIFSYNSQRAFPWIIEVLNIEPFYFYKVIEVIIRTESGLSRDVVKHLNHIEEQILESLAWKSDSPLWEEIKESGQSVPLCADVLTSASDGVPLSSSTSQSASPALHPTVQRLASLDRSGIKSPQQSPLTPSLADRYHSPGTVGGSAKRRLFTSTTSAAIPGTVSASVVRQLNLRTPGSPVSTAVVAKNMDNGQKVLLSGANLLSPQKMAYAFTVQSPNDGGCATYIPTQIVTIASAAASPARTPLGSMGKTTITAFPNASAIKGTPGLTPDGSTPSKKVLPAVKPKRTGSLGLFFRKFYHLASVRLRDLFDRLNITDEEFHKMIWTCFEHSVVNHTNLLSDRHLDQLIMSAIYAIGKVTGKETSFQDIMKCYRVQPQALSHVYRSVLLCSHRRRLSGSSEGSKNGASGSNSPIPMEREEDKDKDEKRKLRLTIRSSSTLPADTHSSSQPTSPTKLAGTSSSYEFEDRGDLIKFYNTVYIPRMQSFILKFYCGQQTELAEHTVAIPLSPLPIPKSYNMSPRRRVSNSHAVYVSPMKGFPSPNRPLCYNFNRSPAKDLRAINNMVRLGGECRIGKRILQDDVDSDNPAKRACDDFTKRRIHSVITERQGARGAAS